MKRIFLLLVSLVPLTALAQTPLFSVDGGGRITADARFIDPMDEWDARVAMLNYTLDNTLEVAGYTVKTGRYEGWESEQGEFDVVEFSRNGEQKLLYRATEGLARMVKGDNRDPSYFADFSVNGYFIEMPLGDGSTAAVFLGQHYPSDLTPLIIFVITGADVKLVHDKRLNVMQIYTADGDFTMVVASEMEEAWEVDGAMHVTESPTHRIFLRDGMLYFKDN